MTETGGFADRSQSPARQAGPTSLKRQRSWSAILLNSSGPKAVSRVQFDGGGDDEPAALVAEPSKLPPSVLDCDCRNARNDCGVSPLAVEPVDDAVAVAAVGEADVAVVVAAVKPTLRPRCLPASAIRYWNRRHRVLPVRRRRFRFETLLESAPPIDADRVIDSRDIHAAAADRDAARIAAGLLEPGGQDEHHVVGPRPADSRMRSRGWPLGR